MMKHILLILLVASVLIGCNVPEDVPSAEIEVEGTEADPTEIPDALEDAVITEVPFNIASSSFEFEGYAPGKSHAGTFDDFDGIIFIEDNAIVGFSSNIIADSVNTGIGGLDAHLKNEDFFDTAQYPEITFTSMTLEGDTLSGPLTFHGVTHDVSFPVTVTENTISTEFLLDTTPFNMKNVGVDKNVRIAFTFSR